MILQICGNILERFGNTRQFPSAATELVAVGEAVLDPPHAVLQPLREEVHHAVPRHLALLHPHEDGNEQQVHDAVVGPQLSGEGAPVV